MHLGLSTSAPQTESSRLLIEAHPHEQGLEENVRVREKLLTHEDRTCGKCREVGGLMGHDNFVVPVLRQRTDFRRILGFGQQSHQWGTGGGTTIDRHRF